MNRYVFTHKGADCRIEGVRIPFYFLAIARSLIRVLIAAYLGPHSILDWWMSGGKQEYFELYPENKAVAQVCTVHAS